MVMGQGLRRGEGGAGVPSSWAERHRALPHPVPQSLIWCVFFPRFLTGRRSVATADLDHDETMGLGAEHMGPIFSMESL